MWNPALKCSTGIKKGLKIVKGWSQWFSGAGKHGNKIPGNSSLILCRGEIG